MIERFKEYLDSRGKLVEKPATEQVPDYTGPKTPGPSDNGSTGRSEKGLADKGHDRLVYEPKADEKFVLTKSEAWIKAQKDKPLSEFIKTVAQESFKEDSSAFDVIKQAVGLCKLNPRLLDSLVREMRRSDLLGPLVTEAFAHDDAYKGFVSLLADDENGDRVARRLVATMNESVGPAAHDEDELLDDEESEKKQEPVGDEGEDEEGEDAPLYGDEEETVGDEDEEEDEENEEAPRGPQDKLMAAMQTPPSMPPGAF